MARAIAATSAALLGIVVGTRAASRAADPPAPDLVPVRVGIRAEPFPPSAVRLLDGPFKQARDADAGYLLSLEPDRLLARFRKEAGLEPRAEGYGGWESQGISGHSMGHYLSALANMYAGTGDDRFRERAAAVVDELAECQARNGDGYVAAIPEGRRVFAEVARGDIRSKGFDLNGLWVPWYTMHKLMAGLRDCYRHCGNEKALSVLLGLGDWALRVTDALDEKQLNQMLRCEHGGMNEVSADLYAITSKARYLELSRRFNDHEVLDPLSRGEDILPGLHANTQIPKVIGAARQHELVDGEEPLGSAARFFWSTVTSNHTYTTGGNSMNEYFGPAHSIGNRLDGNTTETCNTYNMLRLTRKLHSWSGDAAYMDYYERALFNHILASQNPLTGGVCYYVPLRAGSRKPFQGLFDAFTCCVGTGMENHASYGDAIYSRGPDGLMVNLFIASELRWDDVGVVLRQETTFPDEAATHLTVACPEPREWALSVRHPAWCDGFAVTVNGEAVAASAAPGTYTTIRRTWAQGDRLDVTLPMRVIAEPTPDDRSRVALLAGPIVLAGIVGTEAPPPPRVPHIVSESRFAEAWLSQRPGDQLEYETRGVVRPEDLTLVPFFRIRDEHYMVYWKHLTPEQWAAQEEDIRAEEDRRRELQARTVDFVQPGEMQPERDHAFDGERTNHGEHLAFRWRDAHRGGWFAFTMRVPEGPCNLVCTYWGSDSGGRVFDVLVDDATISTQTLNNNRPGEFYDEIYAIPPALTRGKATVRVKFQAHPTGIAGGVFGCRIVKRDE